MKGIKTVKDLLGVAKDTDSIIVHRSTSLANNFRSPCFMDTVKLFKVYRKQYGAFDNVLIHSIDKETKGSNTEWYVVISA